MRLLLLTFFLLPHLLPAQIRRAGPLRGVVVDSTTRKPLREASVSLLNARDSAYVTYSITNGDGGFSFRNLNAGRYRVLVTFVGYRSFSRTIQLGEEGTSLDTLALQPSATLLDEVVVKQESAPISMKGDTVEFNAGSFKTQPNAAVEELLKKLPGVEVARDGTVKAQGQEVKRVFVDGKPFFGDDPKMATRNLPADIIDKVQLYDQQSDQSQFSGIDDGSRDKAINLTTKRDKRKGYFGQNAAGVGTDGRYLGRLNLNRFNNGRQISLIGQANNLNQQNFTLQDGLSLGAGAPGGMGGGASGGGGPVILNGGRNGGGGTTTPSTITEVRAGGLNYRDAWGKRAEVSASYFANHTAVSTSQQSRRENILPGQSFLTEGGNESLNRSDNHRLALRLDYKLDSLTSLRVTSNLSGQTSRYTSLNRSESITAERVPLNASRSDYRASGQGLSGVSNALLMRKFRRDGRTLSLNWAAVLNQQDSRGFNQATNTVYPNGNARLTTLDQQSDQENFANSHTLTASFTEPLSFTKKLEVHAAFSTNGNTSDRDVADFNEKTNAYDRPNAALSNRFGSRFNTERTGLTLQNRRLRYTYALGFDVQQASLRADNQSSDSLGTRRYFNLLPNALLSFNFGRNRSLRLQYRTRINAPSVSQLQPVANNTNPLNIQLGNPDLKPEFYNTVSMVYNQFSGNGAKSLFAALNLNQVPRRIVNATTVSAVGAQTTRPVNAEGYYAASGFLALGRPLTAWRLNVNLSTNAALTRGVSFVNDQPNRSRSLSLGQGLSLASNFNGKLDFNVGGNLTYQTAIYSLQAQQNTEFFTKTLNADLYYQLPWRLVLTSDVTYTANTGRSAGYNQNFALWNLGLARQFFKNRQGELKLSVYDLLNQNRSLVRNVTDTYLEDVQSVVLRRYFLLSFTYNLRKFGV